LTVGTAHDVSILIALAAGEDLNDHDELRFEAYGTYPAGATFGPGLRTR
jgi:hypothetical protein